MSRRFSGLAVLLALCTPAAAQPPAVEHAAAVRAAVAAARDQLAANDPAAAARTLEAQLEHADGNRAFLALLREAYTEELRSIAVDPARAAVVRERVALLGGRTPAPAPAPIARGVAPDGPPEPRPAFREPPPVVAPAPAADRDPARDAAAAFKAGRYADAATLFAEASKGNGLSPDEGAAWAYCRIKLAADRLNAPGVDGPTAAALERDVTDALALAPNHAKLQSLGQTLLATARQKRGATPPAPAAAPAADDFAGWDVVETASFRVRHRGAKATADAVATAAEAQRAAVFERWSGPASGAWEPKCEVVVHPSAAEYAKATARPAHGTGHAVVRFTAGRVASRRIDLRADDASLTADALPRELTHVALADLFPTDPPPKWAETGMAVLACSPAEVGRYTRTLPRLARDGQVFAVPALMDAKDFPPAERITGFYCGSVSLVEYLVRLKGERNFTIFLRDVQRYGTASALKKTYAVDGPPALDQFWRAHAFPTARGQGP